MSLHKEISFENEICDHLAAHGWLYAEGDAAHYDRPRALFPADVLAWVQATQSTAWETLTKNHGARAAETLLARLRDQLDQRGTLDVLRHGIELLGLRQPLKLAELKPAMAMNKDIVARYEANRLRVVRQVRYSLHNENAIDLVLFLNGLPVATVDSRTTRAAQGERWTDIELSFGPAERIEAEVQTVAVRDRRQRWETCGERNDPRAARTPLRAPYTHR